MAETVLRGDFEQNLVKFTLAVNRGSRRCYEEAFSLLYQAWGRGRSYESLQDFCVHALGWRREDVVNLLCEAQLGFVDAPGMRCVTHKPDDSSAPNSPAGVPATSGVPQEPEGPREDATLVYGGCHLIKSGRRSTRRERPSRKRPARTDVAGRPLSLMEADRVPHAAPDSLSEVSDDPDHQTQAPVHAVKFSVVPIPEHCPFPGGCSRVAPSDLEVVRVAPSEQKAVYSPPPRGEIASVAPSAQTTDRVAPSGKEGCCLMPSVQGVVAHVTPSSGREADHAAVSGQEIQSVSSKAVDTSHAPSEQAATNSAPSEQAATNSAPSEQAATNSAPSEQAATNSAPSEQAATNSAPSEQAATNFAPSEQAATNSAPSEQAATNSTSSEQAATNSAPSEQAVTNSAPSEQAATNSAPSEQAPTNSALSEEVSNDSVSSEQAVTLPAPSEQAVTLPAPSKHSATHSAPSEQAATNSAPSEEAPTNSATSEQASTTSAQSEQATTNSAPSEQAVTLPAPSKHSATHSAPSEQAATSSAPSEQAATNSAPSEQAVTNSAPSEQAGTNSAPSEQAATHSAPSEQAGTNSAPSEQAATTSVPSEQAVTDSTPSEQAATPFAPSKQAPTNSASSEVPTNSAPSEQAPTNSAPSEAPTNSAPSEQASTNSAQSEQAITNAAPSEQASANSAPSEQAATHSAPSEQAATRSAPSEQAATNSAPSEQAATHSAPSEQAATHSAPSEQAATNSAPSEQAVTNSARSEQAATHSAPSEQAEEALPSTKVVQIAPSKQQANFIAGSQESVDHGKPSAQEVDIVARSEQTDNAIALSPEAAGVAQPQHESDVVLTPPERVDSVLPPPERVDSVLTPPERVDSVTTTTERVDSVILSTERVDNVLSPIERANSVLPSTDKVYSVLPPTETVDSALSPLHVVKLTVSLSQNADSAAQSTENVVDGLALPEPRADSVSLRQGVAWSEPSEAKCSSAGSSAEEVNSVIPPAEDADVGVSPPQEVRLSSVIVEARQALKDPNGCPLGNFHIPDSRQDGLLSSELDPKQLPERVLVLLLTEVFSQLSGRVRRLVERLQRLSFVVCFRDLEFDDEYLALRLRDLSNTLSELMSIVFQCCKDVAAKHIKEKADKLRISKQRLRRAQKDYEDHLEKVFKTREELQDAERDLKEAKLKNNKVFKVYSRSQSKESEETETVASTGICAGAGHNYSRGTIGNSAVPHVTDHADSGNFSLADELHGRGSVLNGQDGAPDADDSLLVSVIKEFAAIESRHSGEGEIDSMLEKLLRNTYDSVILTKKEMRNRLDSNVSAEQDAIAKQDVLNERQAVTNKVSRELRRLRRDHKALQEDESGVIYRISNDIETIRLMELDEGAQLEGQRIVQLLREARFGRLLTESRQEVASHASNLKVLDLGEWLMRRRYVMTGVSRLYSRVRVCNTEETVDITDILGIGEENPSVVVLSGPKGSGKSCVCHYLLHLWKSKECLLYSKLHEFDLVVYCAMSSIAASGSWRQYLREHVFFVTLNDFPDLDIHDVLKTATVLFLVDVGTPTPTGSRILSDIFTSLRGNRIVITARSGTESTFVEMAKGHNLSCFQTELCPMTPEAIKSYSSQLVSLFEQEDTAAEVKVNKFVDLIGSMKTTKTLLYPLPVAYLLYLWRIDPGHTLMSTTVSRLFSQIVMACQLTMTKAIEGDKAAARAKVERYTEELYRTAWSRLTQQSWPQDDLVLLEPGHRLLQDPMFFGAFSPLVVTREEADGQWLGNLPHPSVADVLCGFFLTSQRLSRAKGSSLLRRREKLDKYCVPEVQRFRYGLPHAAGALVYNKHSLEDAREIATLYFKSLSEDRDMVSWLELLRECDFLSNMCSAVSGVLSRYTSWTATQYNQQTNCAVADLIGKGAYQPQLVIVSETLQGRECACGVDCIVRALSTCTSTLVHLRQESQFYAWGEDVTCDSLVVPLQPPGTLQEFWGHLGVEGAMALRHSHHLEELNVRISSCDALSALVHSMGHIRRSLRYLYLRLDIVPSTPVSSFEPLRFRGKNLWLRMRGISDSSVGWVRDVTKRLSSWYTEILLEESGLSPSALQSLKESWPHTPVHISG